MNNFEDDYLSWFPKNLSNTIDAVAYYTQTPVEMIGTLMLGVMSEVTQGHADVVLPSGQLVPLSTWVLIISASGSGKTPALNILRKDSILEFEQMELKLFNEKLNNYNQSILIWKAELSALTSQLKKSVTENEYDLSTWKEKIHLHHKNLPEKPKKIKLTYSDSTIEALQKGLAENSETACFVSDEGSSFFNGRISSGLASLNQIWDGQRVCIDRCIHETSLVIENPRLSIILGIQPGQLKKFLQKKGCETRDLGSFSRMLICAPFNNQGYRYTGHKQLDTRHIEKFNAIAKRLLNKTTAINSNRSTIRFSDNATNLYYGYCRENERRIAPSMQWEDIKDFISKTNRHVAKIAALFEIFETGETTIQESTLEKSIKLTDYFTRQYQNIFSTSPYQQQIDDAEYLASWLPNFSKKRNNRYLMFNDIRQHAPNHLRNTKRLREAIIELDHQKYLFYDQRRRLSYVDIAPGFSPDERLLNKAIRDKLDNYK